MLVIDFGAPRVKIDFLEVVILALEPTKISGKRELILWNQLEAHRGRSQAKKPDLPDQQEFIQQPLKIGENLKQGWEVYLEKNIKCKYTNSLFYKDLFYANFMNTTFQKIPIPHLARAKGQIISKGRFDVIIS